MDDVAWSEDIAEYANAFIDWENLETPTAPLTPEQWDLLKDLEELVEDRPFPQGLYDSKDEKPSRQSNKIHTVEQFLTVYSEIEDKVLASGDDKYVQCLEQLTEWRNESDEVLEQVEGALQDLENLLQQYELVSNNNNTLHDACQPILLDLMKLSETGEEIKNRLEYFTCLESLQQRLSNPTLSVTSDTFINILNRLDECLDYVKTNSSYKESNSYHAKLRYCLGKAVNMMKQHVTQSLDGAKNQVLQAMATHASDTLDKPDGSNFAIFFGRFQAFAFKIKKVIYNVELRLDKSPEYENLLTECHEIYLDNRKVLMAGSVQSSIMELSTRHRGDHCTLVRSGCAFIVHICTDEYQLFFKFFHKMTPLLTAYLESLCLCLYDILRPIIIHVNHLETLAELCSILRLEMLEEHVHNSPQPLEAFSKVVWQLLHDVQERLVFRAHLYLQSDILNYKPSPGDLAYPEKLEMMESIALSLQEHAATPLKRSESKSSLVSVASATSQEVERINSGDGHSFEQNKSRTGNSPADMHGMWYPPVRRTLATLSRLYRCVELPIFQGLSQEALTMCVQSVTSAAGLVAAHSSVLDGKLFEMKHLLILWEQVTPFQVDFTVKEMSLDFTKAKSAAYTLMQKRNRLFSLGLNNAILEFLLEGTPTVKELTVDSRKQLDNQLKQCCEAFIAHASQMLVGSMQTFHNKASVFVEAAAQKGDTGDVLLRNQPFASPEQIGAVVQDTQRLIKNNLPVVQRAMQLYLANKETELILYRPIKNNVVNSFQAVQQIITDTVHGYSEEDRLIIGLPTHEQVLMLLSTATLSSQQHSDIEPIMETSRPESRT